MPVTTRNQRARQEAAACLSTVQIPADGHDTSELLDETPVQDTTSDTGEGIYSETAAGSNPSLLATEQSSQCDNVVTPVSSMPFLPPSIHAPRRRAKHHSKPADAHRLVRPPLAPENTMPWEMDLEKVLSNSSTARVGSRALGPHGTWLVDEEGNCIITPASESSALSSQRSNRSQEWAINESTTSNGNDETMD